ncbi:unnamed protein product [Heterobilharzia americana]|nr:unnamed protein product [Heterobilharzia americana]
MYRCSKSMIQTQRLTTTNFEPPINKNLSRLSQVPAVTATGISHCEDTTENKGLNLSIPSKSQRTETGDFNTIMQNTDVKSDSLPSCSHHNDKDLTTEVDEDDESSSASRYSTANSSPFEETESDVNKKTETNKNDAYNQDNNNNNDKLKRKLNNHQRT